ncbi:MAG: feruloyl-CoA synthase [Alphaproteobacteria bacterium]
MLNMAPPEVLTEPLPGGGLILRSPQNLAPYPTALTAHLMHWAEQAPDRIFLAQRHQESWQYLSFAEAYTAICAVGQAMLDRRLGPNRPAMILSDNAIDHAIVALAAIHIGAPVAPVSPAYSLMSKDFAKLKHAYGLIEPGLLFADDGAKFAAAVDMLSPSDEILVYGDAAFPGRNATSLASLRRTIPTAAVNEHYRSITGDTVAKILFTSGSTGLPKGVINTHTMLCSNQQSVAQVWPFLGDRPPRLVDWLPWSHTFGGNNNLGLILRHGGTLYIDGGKPTPALIDRTIANLREISPTIYFNVPRGLQMIAARLADDDPLAEKFFASLDAICFAGAALPPTVWQQLARRARDITGTTPAFISAWGSTETAPMATSVHSPDAAPENIGLPGPGSEIKLTPVGDKLELRVRGPGVTPGYWRDAGTTAAAFDEDGYLRMGDAGRLADAGDPTRGLLFDGRTAENFKQLSGTWVHVGAIRVAAISAAEPVIQDVVVTGEGRAQIGLLIFPSLAGCRVFCDRPEDDLPALIADPALRRHLQAGLAAYNKTHGAGSQRIARVLLMSEPPSIDANEITDKGYLNQRAILRCRADLVARLYDGAGPDIVIPP